MFIFFKFFFHWLVFQIKMFKQFHSEYNSPCIGYTFGKLIAERFKMHWRTVDNYLDDGVFVMSHMNMYFGESENEWDYGFLKESDEQTKQLDLLRFLTFSLTFLIYYVLKYLIFIPFSHVKNFE